MKNAKLAFFNFFSFVSIGSITSLIIVMINELGASSFEKNSILGLSALLSFLMAVLIGRKSDREGTIRSSFILSMSLYLVSVFFSFMIDSVWFKAISILFMFGVMKSVMSCTETLIYIESKENFGKYHCFGALGSICGSLIGAALSDMNRMFLCLGCGLISILIMMNIQENKRESQQITLEKIRLLFTNKEYLCFVSILFFLMLIGYADQFVVVDKMIALGANKSLISIKYALQALMEIPLYLFSRKLFEKFDAMKLLLFCIVMSWLKFILYGVVNQSWMILGVSMMQVVTHPLIVILSKKLIAAVTFDTMSATSQIVGFAIYFGMSGFLTPVLSQMLLNWFSFDTILYIFAFFAIFPLFIWLYVKKYGKVEKGENYEKLSD